jgi:hypothetical protein
MNLYSLICYLVLANGEDGPWTLKHPDYLYEKSDILLSHNVDWAFANLDYKNMARAVHYCERWGVPVPEEWRKELTAQQAAAAKDGSVR